MIILPSIRGVISKPVGGASGAGPVAWSVTFGDTTTLTAPPNPTFTATTSINNNGFGTFSTLLSATGQYYIDVTLTTGQDSSPSAVIFLGIANQQGSFPYTTSANYKAWYWSGGWFGTAADDATTGPALIAGTYRVAVDRTNGRFYMQRTSGTPSIIRSANLPTGSNMYLVMLPQGGFTTGGASILNGGAFAGHGGLY